jgi:glycosyltransferase involved in cell wall biosynthesis
MEPLVSVIIPVYRTEEYLAECVESIRNQTYPKLEIILVDDGSPDGAPAMCDEYARQDPRIRVIHKQNGGLSDARNAGKAVATGQYLTFLDSDDILAPETVEFMLKLAREENAQVVKIGVIRKYQAEQCVTVLKEDRQVMTGYDAMKRIFWDNSQIITICGKLFDARLFEGLDFPVGLYYEDEYTTPRIYHRAKTVVLSNSELYFYMQRENESILRGALNEKRIRDSIFVTEDRIQFLREAGYGKLIRKAVRDHYLKLRKLETAAGENPGLEESCEKLRQQRKALTRRYPLVVLGTNLKQWLWAVKHRLQS